MVNNVIIVAGGKGLRMGNEMPKQFIQIAGKPILMRTVEPFFRYDPEMNIVIVLPAGFESRWDNICKEFDFRIPHKIVIGGETRFHSVRNGLKYVESGIVAVHDGARPFVSEKLIGRTFELAKSKHAVIPVTDVTDSLRKVNPDCSSRIINRSEIKQVQTPQVFPVEMLKNAYMTEYDDSFTDDASVVEKLGIEIHLTEGEITNIKVTTPFDLKIGELILKESI